MAVVAGCGADAAPFASSTHIAGQKLTRNVCQHWVTELAQVPSRYIHAPWRAPDRMLRTAGVTLGRLSSLLLTTRLRTSARWMLTEEKREYLLLLHAAATCYMCGVIWFVQLVHYPLFRCWT